MFLPRSPELQFFDISMLDYEGRKCFPKIVESEELLFIFCNAMFDVLFITYLFLYTFYYLPVDTVYLFN